MNKQNRAESSSAKEALNKLKMEVADEVVVDLKSENLTARDAGKVGGTMVKKLIDKAENNF